MSNALFLIWSRWARFVACYRCGKIVFRGTYDLLAIPRALMLPASPDVMIGAKRRPFPKRTGYRHPACLIRRLFCLRSLDFIASSPDCVRFVLCASFWCFAIRRRPFSPKGGRPYSALGGVSAEVTGFDPAAVSLHPVLLSAFPSCKAEAHSRFVGAVPRFRRRQRRRLLAFRPCRLPDL